MLHGWTNARTFLALAASSVAMTGALTFAQQGQPQIGIAPVTLGSAPYVFDTAEIHRIRAVGIARGLSHPFSLTFLPTGEALITERGTRVRIVHNATGQGEQRPVLDPAPVAGAPETIAFRGGGLQEIAAHPQFAS